MRQDGRSFTRRRVPPRTLFDLTRDGESFRPSILGGSVAAGDESLTLSSCTVLAWCAGLCAASPLARELWDFAARLNWTIGFGELGQAGFALDCERQLLVLNEREHSVAVIGRSSFGRHTVLADLIRALRDVWHEAYTPAAGSPYHVPDDMLVLERARAADGAAVLVAVAWDLREAGLPGLWRHLVTEHDDLAGVFGDAMENGGLDGALAEAFREWFADPLRVELADRQTLAMLEAGVPDASPETLPAAPDLIEALSCLPGGPPYLEGLGWAICNDPAFSGIGSAVVRTHLAHLRADRMAVPAVAIDFRDPKLARLIFPD